MSPKVKRLLDDSWKLSCDGKEFTEFPTEMAPESKEMSWWLVPAAALFSLSVAQQHTGAIADCNNFTHPHFTCALIKLHTKCTPNKYIILRNIQRPTPIKKMHFTCDVSDSAAEGEAVA